jgi:hypothetical protein
LDKIKSTAATITGKDTNVEEKLKKDVKSEGNKSAGKWDALKDDFMMNPKKVSRHFELHKLFVRVASANLTIS